MSLNSGACALIVFSVTEEDSLQEADEILQQLWQAGEIIIFSFHHSYQRKHYK